MKLRKIIETKIKMLDGVNFIKRNKKKI